VGVHPAVLAHRVPPLLPQRGRVGRRRVRRVGVAPAPRASAEAPDAGAVLGRRRVRLRGRRRGRGGLLLARHSKDGSFGGSDSPRVREGGRRRLGCRKARRSQRDGCGRGGAAEFKAGERGGRERNRRDSACE
jgi:hypothetical protein